MKLKFLGRGGAFAPMSIGNSNMMFTSDSGKRMMFDFGATAPYIYRDEWGMDFKDIDAIYITHQHGDHIAGLELFAFSRYFMPKREGPSFPIEKPKLYANRTLMKELWEHSLRGGLESLQGKIMSLTDYFDCKPISDNKYFDWEGYRFTPIQTVHVRSGYIIKHSYGLGVSRNAKADHGFKRSGFQYDAYITADTQHDMGLVEYCHQSAIVFHDCETTAFKSGVHPNYEDLLKYPEAVRSKMWMYHYGEARSTFKEDGFAGFVEKGQEFTL